MKLRVDPLTIALVTVLAGSAIYLHQGAKHKETTDIDGVYCIGACALIKGKHTKHGDKESATEEVAK